MTRHGDGWGGDRRSPAARDPRRKVARRYDLHIHLPGPCVQSISRLAMAEGISMSTWTARIVKAAVRRCERKAKR